MKSLPVVKMHFLTLWEFGFAGWSWEWRERTKEEEERRKEKKEVKRFMTCFEHRWTHTVPRWGQFPSRICDPSQGHGGFVPFRALSRCCFGSGDVSFPPL